MASDPNDSQVERISKFLAGIVEARDPELGGHHERLGESAVQFARHIGSSAEEAELLFIGARIHDIGKLSISEHILNKPTRLTAAEFAFVKQHAEIGTQLLAPLGLDSRIADIVYYHHENYDGSGYPRGLAGEGIPLFARMVRIWDSFDALVTDRPYHQGVSGDAALRTMQCESHCYDPNLLNAFCVMMTNNHIVATG
jgi:HD-GYP domain-containing protein (c-di-GMP phosphodiesterase class II)